MANESCIHCPEQHPSNTAFCPNTGKAISGQARPFAATPVTEGRTGRPPSAAPHPTAAPAPNGGAHASPPSWVATPQGPPPIDGDTGLSGPPETGVFDILQSAFELYKKNAKLLITVAAVVFVPGALAHACARAAILAPTIAVNVALDPVTHLPTGDPHTAGVFVAGFSAVMLGLLAAAVTGLFFHGIIVPLAQGALAVASGDRLSGGNAGWRQVWTWFMRRLGTVLSAVIPAALLVGVGFFFLVVPGLVLAFFFSFVPSVALFEGIGGTAALRRSYALVRSDWLRMLLVLLVFGVISGVAQFVAGLISVGLFGSRLLQDALTLVVLPIPVLASVLLYFDVRRKHDADGFSAQRLAAEMENLRRL